MAKETATIPKTASAEKPVLNLSFAQLQHLISNTSTARTELLKTFLDGTRLDINFECNYPDDLTIKEYKEMYDREGLGRRVVCALPEESWAEDPEIYENDDLKNDTEFEKALQMLITKKNIFHFLERIDRLSGIGRFGVLLIGTDDGQDLSKPLEGVTDDGDIDNIKPRSAKRKLTFLRTFDESVVTVGELELNAASPRYGQPVFYQIQFEDRAGVKGNFQTQNVHWTRLIHVADNREQSEIYGTPRIQWLFNRLYDLRKILSGSGEMYWKGAFPGYSIEVNGDNAGATLDTDTIKEELENYNSGLQRWLTLNGVSAKSLAPQVASPKDHVEVQLDIIAIAMGVPKRILFGSEEAKLASATDSKTWNKRLARRQKKYLSPMLIRPFIDRLIQAGILPAPKEYTISWEDLNTTSREDEAKVAALLTEAIVKYVSGGADTLVPPLEFLTIILGMEKLEAEAIIKAAEKHLDDMAKENPPPEPVPAPPGVPPARGQAAPTPPAAPAPAGGKQLSPPPPPKKG